jgi:hypothetical protein
MMDVTGDGHMDLVLMQGRGAGDSRVACKGRWEL